MQSVRRQVEQVSQTLAEGRSRRISSPALVIAGYVMCVVVVLLVAMVAVVADDLPSPPIESWALLVVVGSPTWLFGWLTARYNWLDVAPEGVRVVNPLNCAYVPWSEIAEVDEDGNGLLCIRTRDWAVGSWAVQSSRWEFFVNRPGRVDLLAEALSAHAKRAPAQDTEARKQWRLPMRPVLALVPFWVVVGILLLM